MRKTLAIIPARAGSKGLKDKNVMPICGKPLLAWTVEAALGTALIDSVVLSTDSKAYADIGKSFGARVPFLREDIYSSDTASLIDVVKDTVDKLHEQGEHYDVIIVLQPTSPLRTTRHIDEALNLFFSIQGSPKSLASVYEVERKYRWLLNTNTTGELRFVDDALNSGKGFRRQDNTPVYMPNGAIFIYERNALAAQYQPTTYPFVMTASDSVDIDTLIELEAAEVLLAKTLKPQH